MNLKSRKLLCATICFACASAALLYGMAEFKDWADFVKWIFGLYAAGNVGEHVAKKKI
ncbi:MAG: hypothetical protein O3A15_00035 [Proteobacteria bacterium]|jgi:hypothetical protein|nr:hypothetical protein [Pseudomonadota bacterium]